MALRSEEVAARSTASPSGSHVRPADDDVVVHGDAERGGDVDDRRRVRTSRWLAEAVVIWVRGRLLALAASDYFYLRNTPACRVG